MNYQAALDYIYSFIPSEMPTALAYSPHRYKIERMERLLAALGDPHKKFRSVHIAGTKGKGSTAALTESILRAAGIRTALYTSPHLHSFRERMRVAGEKISQDEVAARTTKLQPLVAQIEGVTTFEIITALAFDYFAAQNVDIAVIEVGLGGRLDATNVLQPLVSVITPISFDHMAILGDTLEKIAREKAGIIKARTPVVIAPQRDEARAVFEEVARGRGAELIQVSKTLTFQVAGSKFQVLPKDRSLEYQKIGFNRIDLRPATCDLQLTTCDLRLPLLGNHQLANAATAFAAIQVLRAQGIAVSDEAISRGIANVEWQGRFEILARDPFFIVDGAHNADSAHQLVLTLRDYFPRAPLHFIFGASSDKDIEGMFAEILPHAASLTLTRSIHRRASDPARLAELAANYRVETRVVADVESAIRAALAHQDRAAVVCVTGSLFLVGAAREIWFAQNGVSVEKD
ncbi:MAG: bifunctional folylpolyglutamate synthase/dihydrofolate synthase [Chloroflexi bacterium]|nr:bifunctional folylpolyglutamate synthase/dihydrofolate synthase [Chloroflexota bacterium]